MQLNPIQRFFRLLAVDRREIYYIYLYSIFVGLITLSLPLGIQAIIGMIAGGGLSISLFILIGVVTVGTALTGGLTIMQLTVTETLQRRIFTRAGLEFAYRIPRIQQEAVRKEYLPELVNRFFDTLTVQKSMPKILTDFSSALLQIIFGLILIAFYHPFFVFFGLMLVVLLILIFRFTGPGGLQTSLKESKYKYMVAHWLEELGRAMPTFKLAGVNNWPLHKTDGLVQDYLNARHGHFKILLFQYGTVVLFKVVVTASLLVLGSYLVIENEINIGQFVAAEIVIILIIASIEKLILSMETIYDMLTALEKIGAVTDIPLEKEEGLRYSDIDNGKGVSIELSNISYGFPDSKRPVLKNLNLQVAPSENICISGPSRSGKSTLLKIIAGLFKEYEGAVTYNGIPSKNINICSLRSQIGDVISQEDLFMGTIAENILMGNPELTVKDLVGAAEELSLAAYVRKLPKGYQTIVQPGGGNIPKNIRTKILLARSIVARPKLLIIENFLAFLNEKERRRVISLLTSPKYDWTLIAISNDPTFAAHCDRVIVMEDGQIVKEGPFSAIHKYLLDQPKQEILSLEESLDGRNHNNNNITKG